MPALELRTFETYAAFARAWHAATLAERDVSLEDARGRGLLNEQGTRRLWQLLGLLEDEELVIQLPAWLAEEKAGTTDRTTPTTFVGRVRRETDEAILLADSATTRPLMSLAHQIHALEDGVSNTAADSDRRPWLERQLREKRDAFEDRDGMVGLGDEWLPKSQVQFAFRRGRTDATRSDR